MKKTLLVLLSVLMVATLALGFAACKDPCADGHDLIYTNNTGDTHDVSCSRCDYSETAVAHSWTEEGGTKCVCGKTKPAGADDHTSRTKVDADPADCGNDGTIEYWQCNNCDKKFATETSTEELTAADIVDQATGAHTPSYSNVTETTHDVVCDVCNQTLNTGVAHVYDQADDKCLCGADKPNDGDEITYTHVAGQVQHTIYTNGVAGNTEACTFTGSDTNACVKCEYVYVDNISFTQQSYTIVISGSTGTWTSPDVVASVTNTNATDKDITYTVNGTATHIDGTFTATSLGTYTVKATSVGISKSGSPIEDEVEVIVYTSAMYLTGVIGGESHWMSGTNYSDVSAYKLAQAGDYKSYSIENLLLLTSDGFQVVYEGMKLGESNSWDGVIKNGSVNFTVSESAYYTVTVDISGTAPTVQCTKTDDYTPPADWSYTFTIGIDIISRQDDNWSKDTTWIGNVYTSESFTINANNTTVSFTYDFSADAFAAGTKEVTIGFNANSKWYNETDKSGINYTVNDYLSHTYTNGIWYNYHESDADGKWSDAVVFAGAAVSGKSYKFEFTFDESCTITNITITAA